MTALTLADGLATDMSDETVERRYQYLARCRRIRVGSAVTVVFENSQTLWFRVQELAQVARLTDATQVRTELDWYARLLPDANHLIAAVWVAEPGRRPSKALAAIRKAIVAGRIGFQSDDGYEIPGAIRTDRVGDPIIGLTLWAEFQFTPEDRVALADPNRSWQLFVRAAGYVQASDAIHDDVRASLLEDLI